MSKRLLTMSACLVIACSSTRPSIVTNGSLAISSVACDDPSAAAEAQKAFERAKEALGRMPGVASVSIGECDTFWAGHFYQSIDPTFKVAEPMGPSHECGVRVAFRDRDSLKHYADSAFVFGTFIPYGTQTEVKRARTCGLLAGTPSNAR